MEEKRFPLVEISGSPYDMGYKYGSVFKEYISLSFETMQKTLKARDQRHSLEYVIKYAKRSLPYCEDFAPDIVEEIRGMAAGSGYSFDEVFTLNCGRELTAHKLAEEPEDCTSYAVNEKASTDGGTYVCWNMDEFQLWQRSCVLIRMHEKGKPPCIVFTWAGFVGRPGLNPTLGLAANALSSPTAQDGIPYSFISRKILEQENTADAIEVIKSAKRMGGMNYMLGDINGNIAAVESDPKECRVVDGPKGWVVHTNQRIPTDGGTGDARLVRLREIFDGSEGHIDRDWLETTARDHGNGNICAHPTPEKKWMTQGSLICDVRKNRMWVAYGQACQHKFLEYEI